MRKGLLVLAVLLIIVAGAVAYFMLAGSSEGSQQTKSITDQKTIQKYVLGFVRNPYQDDYGAVRLAGYLDNKSKTLVKSADLELQLYDKSGNRKELFKQRVTDISPNSRKTFDTNAGTISEARTVKIKVVSLKVVQ